MWLCMLLCKPQLSGHRNINPLLFQAESILLELVDASSMHDWLCCKLGHHEVVLYSWEHVQGAAMPG